MKDSEYFKIYSERPLKWLEQHDKVKYDQKMREFQESRSKKANKFIKRSTDPEYREVMQRLSQEVKQLKKKKFAGK